MKGQGLLADFVNHPLSIRMLVSEVSYVSSSLADVSAPVFSNCSKDIVAIADRGKSSTTVTWSRPTATDNSGVTPNLTHIGKQSGDLFPAGKHTIRYLASDNSGNVAECKFEVFVSGIFLILTMRLFPLWFSDVPERTRDFYLDSLSIEVNIKIHQNCFLK